MILIISFILIQGHHKCREQWPHDSKGYERSFNILLDIVLLLVPLLLLASTYSLITKTLWKGMIAEKISRRQSKFDKKQICKFYNIALLHYLFKWKAYQIAQRSLTDWLINLNGKGGKYSHIYIFFESVLVCYIFLSLQTYCTENMLRKKTF